jgi:hypothetical protein
MGTPIYPQAIKVFTTYHDYSDVIWAASINQMQDEVFSIENVLGIQPFAGTPYTTFSGAVHDLYVNKAPLNHSHNHALLNDDTVGDDHLQYIRVDGSRGFTHAVSGPWAGVGSQLVPLSQVQAMGFCTLAEAEAIGAATAAGVLTGWRGGAPLFGTPDLNTWQLQGGVFYGCTSGNGIVTVPFQHTFPHCLQSFTVTKVPVGTGGGCPNGPYNHIEAQVTLVGWALNAASVQFSHDYSWQPGMYVGFSWMALGS